MEALLEKYAAGRIPPLVPSEHEADDTGLLNGHFVEIYQRGFSDKYTIPLGVLAAENVWEPVAAKWQQANYSLNRYAQDDWAEICRRIRRTTEGNSACEKCDREHAIRAEREGKAIAYMCCHGMVDFAVPVRVNGIVIAVLLSGQRKPRPGARWNRSFIEPEGLYEGSIHEDAGVDAWEYCSARIRQSETTLGLQAGELIALLDRSVEQSSKVEVSPEDIGDIIRQLEEASKHLSDLATATFQLEKARIVAFIRSKAAESLKALTAEPPRPAEFWQGVSNALSLAARYFGCGYAAVLSCQEEPSMSLKVSAQWPGVEGLKEDREEVSTDVVLLRQLMKSARAAQDVQRIEARLLAPVVRSLLGSPAVTRGGAALMPAGHSRTSATLVVMGRIDDGFEIESLPDADRQALYDILSVISMIAEVARLVQELELTARRQTDFVLDLAHDLRNPIQNLVVNAELLKFKWLSPDKIAYHAKRIATQVKRLNLLSQRVWTLVTIEAQGFRVEPDTRLRVFDVLRECYDSLTEFASSREVVVTIDPELQQWPALRINRLLFTQAVLNLMDNAIKYSRSGTEVRVSGRQDTTECCIFFSNRGIEIAPEESQRIFEKFYRTPAAQRYVREGSGIGLAIVQKFAEHYGSVSVSSEPIFGTPDHVTVFRLSIRKE